MDKLLLTLQVVGLGVLMGIGQYLAIWVLTALGVAMGG